MTTYMYNEWKARNPEEASWIEAHDVPVVSDYQAGWQEGRDSFLADARLLRLDIEQLKCDRDWLQFDLRTANVEIGRLRSIIAKAARDADMT